MDNILINLFRGFLGECHSHNDDSGQYSFINHIPNC